MLGDRSAIPLVTTLARPEYATAQRPSPPPLRIHHLMVCAVVTAVEMSLLRFALHRSSQQQTIAGDSVFAYTQVLSAIGLTLTGFSIYWWRKGDAAFSQPGQMLLLQYAASFVLQIVSYAIVFAFIGGGGTPRNQGMMWIFTVAFGIGSLVFGVVLPLVFYAWCAWKMADSWPWRILFMCCAIGTVATSTLILLIGQFFTSFRTVNFQMVFSIPYVVRGAIMSPVGVIAAMNDLAQRRERSWTHWVGLILWLLGEFGSLLTGLYYMFWWPGA